MPKQPAHASARKTPAPPPGDEPLPGDITTRKSPKGNMMILIRKDEAGNERRVTVESRSMRPVRKVLSALYREFPAEKAAQTAKAADQSRRATKATAKPTAPPAEPARKPQMTRSKQQIAGEQGGDAAFWRSIAEKEGTRIATDHYVLEFDDHLPGYRLRVGNAEVAHVTCRKDKLVLHYLNGEFPDSEHRNLLGVKAKLGSRYGEI